jgi:c-di-GMP-binding flagellar brake protein YcgR
MIEEKRKYIRLNANIDFAYKIKGDPELAKIAVTKNISPCGIRALLDKEIKNGDWLELGIYIPTLRKPISALCKVIWTGEEKSGKIDTGIKFEEIDADMKNKFLEYICELMFSELERMR